MPLCACYFCPAPSQGPSSREFPLSLQPHPSLAAQTQQPPTSTLLPVPIPQAFYPRLYSRCQAEVFIAGNVAQEAALGFVDKLEAQLRER